MPDFEAMYFAMFNQLTDTIRQMERQIQELKAMQIQMEQQYMEQKKNRISHIVNPNLPVIYQNRSL